MYKMQSYFLNSRWYKFYNMRCYVGVGGMFNMFMILLSMAVFIGFNVINVFVDVLVTTYLCSELVTCYRN